MASPYNFPQSPEPNPYATGGGYPPPPLPPPSARTRPSGWPPIFCLVYFPIDLLFCGLRMVLVLFGLLVLATDAGAGNPMIAQTAVFEFATNLGMVLLGVPANLLMLFRQRWGAYLAFAKIVVTLANIGVGIWQSTFMFEQFPPGSPEFAGGVIGIALATLVRLALIVTYAAATVVFLNWSNGQAAASREAAYR